MSERVSLELRSPGGATVRFEWQVDELERLDASASEAPWTLSGELDWDEIETVRVFSGRLEDGALVIAAVRPRGAAGHGDEAITGILVNDGGAEELDQVLLSTELDDANAVRRVGLELYPSEGSIPLRIAGDATAARSSVAGGLTTASTAFELRAAGASGTGRLEVLTRG